jgi:hypothetical protein
LNFTECNFKFPNNILETEYDRMYRANQAVQAMLSLSSANSQSLNNGQVLMADSAWGRMEENIVQYVSSQGEDEEGYLDCRGVDNQDVSSQGEDEEGYLIVKVLIIKKLIMKEKKFKFKFFVEYNDSIN